MFREKYILKIQKSKLKNVSNNMLIWKVISTRIERKLKNNFKRKLNNLEFKGCKYLPVPKLKWKMIYKVQKNVMNR